MEAASPTRSAFRSVAAVLAAAALVSGCRSAAPAGPVVPAAPSVPAAAADPGPDPLPVSAAGILGVVNRPALLPGSCLMEGFSNGFQRSSFLSSRPGTASDDLRVQRLLDRVLAGWPVPLRGFPYSVRVVRSDVPAGWSYGAGHLDTTTALVSGVGLTDVELEALLAHLVARTELLQQLPFLSAAPDAFHADAAETCDAATRLEDDPPPLAAAAHVARMTDFSFAVFDGMADLDADELAALYLDAAGPGRGVLAAAFGKVAAFDRRTAGRHRGHPAFRATLPAPDRIRRILRTSSLLLHDARASLGTARGGAVRAGFQPVAISRYGPLVVVAAVVTTAPLAGSACLGVLHLRIAGRRAIFPDRSTNRLYAGTSAPVLYRGRLPESASLDLIADARFGPALHGVGRWAPVDAVLFDPAGGSVSAVPQGRSTVPAGSGV